MVGTVPTGRYGTYLPTYDEFLLLILILIASFMTDDES
jgi:hypothetical protein